MKRYAIVPAAGRSRRMGQPKLLLPWQGATVIEHVLAQWRQSAVDEVLLVVHREDAELAAVARAAGVEVLVPATPPPEMRDSVQHALAAITTRPDWNEQDVWLLAPADMPTLSATVIDQVLAAHDPQSPAIVVPRHAGKRGHPVLFPGTLAARVSEIPPDQGINVLLQAYPVRYLETAPPSVLQDIDTPDEYQALERETRGPDDSS